MKKDKKEKQKECGKYIGRIETKDVNGTLMYRTVPSPGHRHLPLGLFKTEEAAIDALHNHLSHKQKI